MLFIGVMGRLGWILGGAVLSFAVVALMHCMDFYRFGLHLAELHGCMHIR